MVDGFVTIRAQGQRRRGREESKGIRGGGRLLPNMILNILEHVGLSPSPSGMPPLSPPLFPLPLRSGCADPQRPSLKELAERCLVVVWQQGGLLLGGWGEGRGGRGKGEGETEGGLKANCPVHAASARSRQRVADRASAWQLKANCPVYAAAKGLGVRV